MTYLKFVIFILFLTVLGAKMLSLRQQRFEINHDITRLHQQMDGARQSFWESQVKVADQLKPAALEHKMSVAELKLEPISTTPDTMPNSWIHGYSGERNCGLYQRTPLSLRTISAPLVAM